MSVPKGPFTEAELKRTDRDILIQIAESKGIEGASELTIPKLTAAILKNQEDNPDTPSNEAGADNSKSEAGAAESQSSEASGKTAEQSQGEEGRNLITVRSTQRTPNAQGAWKQVFRERHPDHPNGEVWIANGKDHRVARTDAVKRAIVDGQIEEV